MTGEKQSMVAVKSAACAWHTMQAVMGRSWLNSCQGEEEDLTPRRGTRLLALRHGRGFLYTERGRRQRKRASHILTTVSDAGGVMTSGVADIMLVSSRRR